MSTDPSAPTPIYADKAFYMAAFGILVPILAKKWGVTVDAAQLATIASMVGMFIGGHHFHRARAMQHRVAMKAAQ